MKSKIAFLLVACLSCLTPTNVNAYTVLGDNPYTQIDISGPWGWDDYTQMWQMGENLVVCQVVADNDHGRQVSSGQRALTLISYTITIDASNESDTISTAARVNWYVNGTYRDWSGYSRVDQAPFWGGSSYFPVYQVLYNQSAGSNVHIEGVAKVIDLNNGSNTIDGSFNEHLYVDVVN